MSKFLPLVASSALVFSLGAPLLQANELLKPPSLEQVLKQNMQYEAIRPKAPDISPAPVVTPSSQEKGNTPATPSTLFPPSSKSPTPVTPLFPSSSPAPSTSNLDPSEKFVYNPSLFRKNLSYVTIARGNAFTIKKAQQEELWLQEIFLDKGARVGSLFQVTGYNNETGEPQFQRFSLKEMVSRSGGRPFSIINGQFFNVKMNPTELAFGLKDEGLVRSAGVDPNDHYKNILIIDGPVAQILPASWSNLENSKGAFAIESMALGYKISTTSKNIGRTYICLKNPTSDNKSSTLLVLTAVSMNDWNVQNEMFRQGCTPKSSARLDASGSSQLWFNGNYIYGVSLSGAPDYRTIPHAIAFYDL